jgi:hypothetical protein
LNGPRAAHDFRNLREEDAFLWREELVMEHIAALLLIVGCSEDLAECRELPAPIPVYETVEECDGDLPVALGMMSGKSAKVMAKCIYVDPVMEEEDAELVWDVDPDGTFYASIEIPDVMVASVPSGGDDLRRQE